MTVWFEVLPDFRFLPLVWHVLDVNVVEDFAEVGFGTRREFHTDIFFCALSLRVRESAQSAFGVTEANKAIPTRFVFVIKRDLAGNNVTIFLEKIFKVL